MHRFKTGLAIVLGLTMATLSHAAEMPAQADVIAAGEKVADWQLRELGYLPGVDPLPEPRTRATAWEIGAFWVGMTHFAETTGSQTYTDIIIEQGEKNDWQLGPWLEFADDHVIGQSYLWAADHGAGEEAIAPMQTNFDTLLADPPVVHLSFWFGEDGYGSAECLNRWCWCDALFMSPPAMIELSNQTGDPKYADYAFSEFKAATDFLYDPAERLYFRDSRFFPMRDDEGRKLFWSRGNGWVFAGIANILGLLPEDHPERAYFEDLFAEMAGRLLELQKPDGYWAPSLLAPEGSPRETSGTGFYTYGLAYGVNEGLLDAETYTPAVVKGWHALEESVAENGRLGWVQQVSDRPDIVNEEDTQYYGVGAFLLAASEVAELADKD